MSKNYIGKAMMYITSLWLLFFLIIIITLEVPYELFNGNGHVDIKALAGMNIIPIISLILLILGILFAGLFNYSLKGSNSSYFKIKRIRNKNYEHLTFLTTYIVPLICFDLTRMRYAIVLFTLLFIIGAIYIKTDLFCSNPTLALLGYHLYEVDVELRDGIKEQVTVIARGRINEDTHIVYQKLGDKIYFVRSRE